MSSLDEDISAVLPWGVIAEYCSFGQVLQTRLVCRPWCEAIGEGLSLSFCVRHLSRCLTERNVYLLSDLDSNSNNNNNNGWKDSATQSNHATLTTVLQQKQQSTTGPTDSDSTFLDQLLRVFRVAQHLPQQVAVAFNGKYGRHCLPLAWDAELQTSGIQSYPSCCRRKQKCPTCRLKLTRLIQDQTTAAAQGSTSISIDDHLELRNKRGPIDLRCYAPKCIPNLPPDLTCPLCRTTDQRTLVLSEFSYKSEPGAATDRPSHVFLTWTPQMEEDNDNDDDDDDGSSRSGDDDGHRQEAGTGTGRVSPAHKRQKTGPSSNTTTTARPHPFPPMYDEMAIPVRNEPIRLKSDCKHAISLHCSKCRNFGIFAPAGVCWNRGFVCHERGRHLEEDPHGTLLGGVLVRTKCSLPDCHRPVSCLHCAHHPWHRRYEQFYGTTLPIRHTSHCNECEQTYCDEHASVSTVCRHHR
jgi:hypothetical protein